MMYPEIPLAQSIIAICQQHQIRNIIISPGSRNAPLTIGFTNNAYFQCYSIADERSAAFFALGIAQQKQEPTILVCTSGSALLNYYPALAEAFYSQIPLVIISADRPFSKIDIGDGQTIRQRNVFENHSLFNANLNEQASQANDLLINQALTKARSLMGPVHINAPFEEPLYNLIPNPTWIPHIPIENPVTPINSVDSYFDTWNKSKKKLVLIGVCAPHLLSSDTLTKLASDNSIVVFTESTSNIQHANFIQHIDRIITPFNEKDFKALQPDLLITFGGMVVSKRIKSFLRSYPAQEHWHIDMLRHYDTYSSLTAKIFDHPEHFLQAVLNQTTPKTVSTYKGIFLEIAKQRQKAHDAYLKHIPYSDMQIFAYIFKNLPQHVQLQISNSAAIRYAQLFDINSNVEVFCNRGTSGIDGSTSTAIGAAIGNTKPTLLITGDIGFFYDNNALWNNYIPKNFKIILINNQGGGIFRILPGHQDTETFNTFFETQHQLTAEHLAAMHGFDYYATENLNDLETLFPKFIEQDQIPAIFEIKTPTTVNNDVLKNYFLNLNLTT